MGKVDIQNETEPVTPTTGNTFVYVNPSTKKLESKDDAGVVTAYGNGAITISETQQIRSLISTSRITGGILSQNGVRFDITAGTGVHIDNFTSDTEVLTPVVTQVSWTAFLSQTAITTTTSLAVLVGIDVNGAVVQEEFVEAIQLATFGQDNMMVGVVFTDNAGNVLSSNTLTSHVPASPERAIADFAHSLGPFKISDLDISANVAANLTFDMATGKSFSHAAFYATERKNPSIITHAAQVPVTFSTLFRDGSGGFTATFGVTDVPAGSLDDGSGVLTTYPANEFANFRLTLSPDSLVTIVYPQQSYTTLDSAQSAAISEPLVIPPGLETNVIIGWISVRGDATDLTDTDAAAFLIASKLEFGSTAAVTLTLQSAYSNSTHPEIVVDTTRGALSVLDNATPIAANLFEVRNNADTVNFLAADVTGSITPQLSGEIISGGDLTLESTRNATKGSIFLGVAATSAYDEVNDRLGVGTAAPSVELEVVGDMIIDTDTLVVDSVNNSVIIGNTAPTNSSVALEVDSTTQAVLLPRMTTVQKNALTAVNGMMLYDTDLNRIQGFTAGTWSTL